MNYNNNGQIGSNKPGNYNQQRYLSQQNPNPNEMQRNINNHAESHPHAMQHQIRANNISPHMMDKSKPGISYPYVLREGMLPNTAKKPMYYGHQPQMQYHKSEESYSQSNDPRLYMKNYPNFNWNNTAEMVNSGQRYSPTNPMLNGMVENNNINARPMKMMQKNPNIAPYVMKNHDSLSQQQKNFNIKRDGKIKTI